MEDTEIKNRKINWAIIIPIIAVIILAGALVVFDYQRTKKENNNGPGPTSDEYRPEPISRENNPRRSEAIVDLPKYGCASPATIEPTITKNPDAVWRIPKDGTINTISLGKYKIINDDKTVLDIPTLWLYFTSEKLSNRDDKVYALENSYVAGMKIIVNGYEKEIKLGGPEYMLIELSGYPLGDIYPYDRETILEFEVLIELECANLQNGICLSNGAKPLDFINDADITSMFRIFAVGCQEFTKDIFIESKFSFQ